MAVTKMTLQKKYFQVGARTMLIPENWNAVRYHMPPISQLQTTNPPVTSAMEFAIGMRFGSRTGGNFRGSHFSMNRDFPWFISSTANTVVMLPITKNAMGQNAVQNDASVTSRPCSECAERETAMPIHARIHGTM